MMSTNDSPNKNNNSSSSSNNNNEESSDEKTEQHAEERAIEIVSQPDVSPESVEEALLFKSKGNQSFSKKEWYDAYQHYSDAIHANPKDATFYSNRSACSIQLQQLNSALYDAVIAKILRPNWSKAYYRLAVARFELFRYNDAALAAWEGLQYETQNYLELKRLLRKSAQHARWEQQQQQISNVPPQEQ